MEYTEYTLSGAAKACGKSKPTVFRWIKSGKLSASRAEDGTYRIDAAELQRVLQYVSSTETDKQPDTADNAAYQQVIGILQDQIGDLRRRLDFSEAERAAAAAEIRRLTTLLTGPGEKILSEDVPKKSGFFAKWFGKSTK